LKEYGFRWLASVALALVSLASASGITAVEVDLHSDGRWGREEHERLAVVLLRRLGAEPQRDCPAEAAFVDHFGTPLCAYLALPFDKVVARLKGYLVVLDAVELGRAHASSIETYLDFYVAGMLHLVDYALLPNAQGEHLLLWFIPDFGPPPE
jgi:hypothetical protein